MNDLIQIIKILEPSELKDLNDYIDNLKFERNQVMGETGSDTKVDDIRLY